VAATLDEEFGTATGRVLVLGIFTGKDSAEMLTALGADQARLVVACEPPWPRALPAAEIVAAAASLGIPVVAASSVREALATAREAAGPDDVVLVTGSLYLVGAARAALGLH
jgi:dihydrofolate synthase/folylpolyglutamate synthase